MAVIACKEISQGRGGSLKEDWAKEYTRVWKVLTDSPYDDAFLVRTHPFIPRLYSLYVTPAHIDLGARCYSIDAQQSTDDPRFWLVTCQYNNTTEEKDENPLLRPTQIRYASSDQNKLALSDIFGNPVRNSAKLEFDPPPEIDDGLFSLDLTKNFATFDPVAFYQYRKAVNSDPWFGAPPRSWKIGAIAAQQKTENNVTYWELSCRMDFKEELWDLRLLDQGFHQLNLARNDWVRLTDQYGDPVSEPVLLNGNGNRLPPNAAPVFLTYRCYRELPFAALNLI